MPPRNRDFHRYGAVRSVSRHQEISTIFVLFFSLGCFPLKDVCSRSVPVVVIVGASEAEGRSGMEMPAAGGCCALQFTSGVSGLCILAMLHNDLIYEVHVEIVCIYIDFCLLVQLNIIDLSL